MWKMRAALIAEIEAETKWDVVIIGGGITGAGILREASRAGLRALLIEQRDFAWGTSSRSSKMVHGGLRYLKQGQLAVTYQSVRERQSLLAAGDGLVEPLGFLMPTYKGDANALLYQVGLAVYDLMALRWGHRQYDADELALLAPRIGTSNLSGGFYFEDAQTDDARLVLRVLQEALADGGTAINYLRAVDVIKEDGVVTGVIARDAQTDAEYSIRARVVINASGAWVDDLRGKLGAERRIRPLRGSHLVFPLWRFPVAQAVSFPHPLDGRPVFVYPWEGVTLAGTTDIDHDQEMLTEPHITGEEVAYLLAACNQQFPTVSLTLNDIIATYAGVRPVIGTGKVDPSKESRDHVVWMEDGLLSVTGGKLTTFRVIALDALRTAISLLPEGTHFDDKAAPLDSVEGAVLPPAADALPRDARQRLIGRYGAQVSAVIAAAQPGELTLIPNTLTLWAELRWAARSEAVIHLDDLLLRRTRLGLLLPQGGLLHAERIRSICQPELGWDDARWQSETERYRALWEQHYHLPPRDQIPDWKGYLKPVEPPTEPVKPSPVKRLGRWFRVMGLLMGAWLIVRWLQRKQ